jgi:hypothetical protein
MSNFTLGEWKNTTKENFVVPEDVRNTITELQTALYTVCKENNVPLFSLTVDSCDEGQGYEVNATQNLPIARTPAELLVVSAVADHGISSGMATATKLFSS